MSHSRFDSEDSLEPSTVALFASLGWETLNCLYENFGKLSLLGPRNHGRPRTPEPPQRRHPKTEPRRLRHPLVRRLHIIIPTHTIPRHPRRQPRA